MNAVCKYMNEPCKACEWINRNKGRVIKWEYDEQTEHTIIKSILESDETIINDLAEELQIDCNNLLLHITQLKIGNKKYSVRCNCSSCGAEIYVKPQKILKNKYIYCCKECYYAGRKTEKYSGNNSKCYKRVQTNCSYCDKPINVIPYYFNKTNKFDDNHNFCSVECYAKFRKDYYKGSKHSGFIWDDSMKEKAAIRAAASMSQKPQIKSRIQDKINALLNEMKIEYTNEFHSYKYSFDIILNPYNLLIEVMGDYWHSNHNKFAYKDLNKQQLDGLKYDKRKQIYAINTLSQPILYLWEQDILNNISLCRALILHYIERCGRLNNYHSFNYEYNKQLQLNNSIVLPYFER